MRKVKVNPHCNWEVLLERHMAVRSMSPKSILAYLTGLRKFYSFFERPLNEATPQDIERYQYELVSSFSYNYNTYCSAVASLRYYYSNIEEKSWSIEKIPRPRGVKKLPIALSKLEASRLFFFTTNIRTRLAFQVIYASGMRISEMLNLKVEDIDGQRERLRIVNGKGRKDREITLWPELRENLRLLYKLRNRRSSPYILTRSSSDLPMDETSFGRQLKVAAKNAKIKKNVTMHTLRHSFATHQLQDGLSIKDLQEMLGHSDIRHTIIYLHMTDDSYHKSQCLLSSLPKLDENGDPI
jgi:integrase/recombinase XerD